MPVVSRLASLLRNLFRRRQVEAELSAELDGFVEALTEEKMRGGLPRDAARLAALREIGGMEAVKEAARDARTGAAFDTWSQDVRYAGRTLRKRPGFTLAVVISLGLGVGGSTAIFSVVHAVLLRPLPYRDAGQLHQIRVFWGDFSSTLSAADRLALREAGGGTATIGGYFFPNNGFALGTPAGPQVVQGAILTPELPRILGVSPLFGRWFTENGAVEPIEALVSEGFWRRQLGGTGDVIGRGLTLDGDAVTIVGVMPAGFNVGRQQDAEVWLRFEPNRPTRRGGFYLHGVARIDPDVTVEAAAVRLTDAATPVLRDRYGVTDRWRYGIEPLKDAVVGPIAPTLRLLFVAVTLVLLIGTLNVSTLLLARGVSRRQELGVRAALGAGRRRLVRQLLVEASLSGLLGGLLGLVLATLLVAAGGRLVAPTIPRGQEIGISLPVVLFALAAGIGAGLLAGAWPALRLPWARLAQEIREGGRSAGAGERQSAARRIMVVAEVALTLTVLTGAALLVRTLRQLESADPGFVPTHVLTFRLALPESSYPDSLPGRFERFSDQVRLRLGALPGVRAVALAGALPPADLQMRNNYTVEGHQPDTRGPGDVAEWIVADTGYFRAMGIPLLAGRGFGAADLGSSPLVAVVSRQFARKHFGDGDPVGKRLKSGNWDPAAPWITIVGVAGDVPYDGGVWGGASPTVYVAYGQNPWWTSPFVVLAGTRDLSAVLPQVQREVAAIDPAIPLRDVASLEQRLARSAASPRLRGALFSALGIMALVLAVTGIYGLLAHEVGQRERETAVRRAMGATTGDVVRLVVASGMRLALIGIGIGVAGALALTRMLRGFLYGVTPADPLSLAAAGLALLAAAFAACLVPARRAARVEPMAVLRTE